jgi:hypothetical protein
MPSTYTVNLGIEKPATGEQSGTWGDTVNDNSNILDEAINGVVSITLASAGSSGSPNSITITNGALSTGRNKWIEFTDGGDLGAAAYVQLTPNDAEKICFIRNSLTASRSIFLFQGTYNASNDLEIAAGTDVVVKFNGGGTGATVVNVYANLKVDGIVATTADINGGTVDGTVIGGAAAAALTATTVVANTSLNIAGTTTISSVLDEDNMASDSATALATQQSIKAYVDSQVGTVDTLSEILANGNTTGANDIDVDAAQKVQFRDAAIYINSSVDGQLDIVADTEIQIAATTVDLNGNLDVSGTTVSAGKITADAGIDIDNINIDGTTIALSSGDLTLDVAGDIILDAAGTQVILKKAGTQFGEFLTSSTPDNLYIKSSIQDKDIIFGGNDGGADITALTLDMSEAGAATFNSSITIPDYIYHTSDANTYFGFPSGDEFELITAAQSRMKLVGTETTFNEGGNDKDFRVESDTITHALFVDGASGNVSIGSSTAYGTSKLSLFAATNPTTASSSAIQLSIGEASQNSSYSLKVGYINIGGGYSSSIQSIAGGNPSTLLLNADGGKVGIGTSDPARTLSIWDTVNGYNLELQQRSAYNSGNQSGVVFSAKYHSDGSITDLASIRGGKDNTTDGDYGGKVAIWTRPNGGSDTAVATWDSQGGFTTTPRGAGDTVFNENGVDSDFRVESDGNANMLFVDGGNNRVGVGMSTPLEPLHATGRILSTTTYGGSTQRIGTSIGQNGNTRADIDFRRWTGASTNHGVGMIEVADTGIMRFYVDSVTSNTPATTERISLDPTGAFTTTPAAGGHAVFNEGGADADFRVESDANANMLFVDAGNNHVNIGTATDLGFVLNVNGSIGGKDDLNITSTGGENYTQGTLQISSSTIDTPTARGQGVLYFNEGHDVTWYTGTGYNQGGDFHIGYATGSSLNTAAARVDGIDNSNMMFTIYRSSGAVFNELGNDQDFRVESDGNANALFVDGGANHIGMGTATLNRSGLGADHIVLTVGADTEMGMLELQGTRTSDADLGRISFLNAGTRRAEIVAARIDADNSTKLYFQTSDAGSLGTRLTIGKDGAATFNSSVSTGGDIILPSTGKLYSSGDTDSFLQFNQPNTLRAIIGDSTRMIIEPNTTVFNEDSADVDFRVESDNDANAFFVQGSNGFVGIGTGSPVSITGAAGPILDMQGPNPEIVFHDNDGTANAMSMYYLNDTLRWWGDGAQNMSLDNSGNLTVAGALSKGSGSFKIDHPLPAKTETHNLVHSFIEGPQADNIYRGKVTLVDGSATVNIDTVSGMSEGTYVLLNTNTQCFTSNESGWTAVKGSVAGNILTIEAQESCSDTISWMVVGERHDQHMLDTEWTDENGKVIVEPLKELES